MDRKVIIYFKSEWIDNIGNAFIDLGAIKSIMQASGVYKNEVFIIPLSQYPFTILSGFNTHSIIYHLPPQMITLLDRVSSDLSRKIKELMKFRLQGITTKRTDYVADIISSIKADFMVVSGAVLTKDFFNIHRRLLSRVKKNGIKIIFNGAGGNDYSDDEVEFVRKNLEAIEPYALITRDEVAFRKYKDLAEFAFNGVDCAFYLNQYPIKEIELSYPPYVVLTFDDLFDTRNIIVLEEELEKEFSKKYMVVKTIHTVDPQLALLRFNILRNKYNVLISDSPLDYLILYAHTRATFTDRVHACVATLTFGNPCRLFTRSPRALLFKTIGAEDVTRKLTFPDTDRIMKNIEKQTEFLGSVINRE